MQVTKFSKTPTAVQLTIEANINDLLPIKNHVLGHFTKSVKVPGFRAGKAPIAMVEKHVDQQRFLDDFLEHALNELYRQAVESENLRPVASPKVELKKFVPYTQLLFEAELEVIGDIKLADYKKIKLAKKPVTVEAKDINQVIDSLLERSAEREEVKRPAKLKDEVIIDFSGKDKDGKPLANTDGKDYALVLGSKSFIPGFEEQLVGLKTGDSKDFDITFPADYGVEEMRSKKVTFSVKVSKVNGIKLPKADDGFAKKTGPFKTLAELKADVKKQLLTEKQNQANREYENELIKKIVDKSVLEVPESLVTNQVERMEEEERRNLVYRGQTWQEHLDAEGVTEEEHRKRLLPDAETRVKAGLILSEIADKEKLTVEPEELKIQLDAYKSQYTDPAMQSELDKPENQQEVAAQLLTAKTINKLVDYAS